MEVKVSDLVSVIIPTYNSKNFLLESIGSVLIQTFTNWELIIVDDGSTDGTENDIKLIVEKDSRIKYFKKKNAGQASARNFGIDQSKGDLIAFLDADDIWEHNKLEVQISIFKKHELDIVFTGASPFGIKHETYTGLPEKQKEIRSGVVMFKELWFDCGITNSSVLIKKESLIKLGGLDENQELRGSEDYEFWLRMAKENMTFYGIDQALVRYRIHSNNTSSNLYRMNLGKLLIYNRYFLNWEENALLADRIIKTHRELLFLSPYPLSTNALETYKEYLQKERRLISTLLLRIIYRLFSLRYSAVCAKFAIFKLANKFSL